MKLAIRKPHRKLYKQLRYNIIEPLYTIMDKIFPDFVQDFYPFADNNYQPRFYYPGKDWWEYGICSYELKQKIKNVKEKFYNKIQTKTGKRLLNWFMNNNCGKLLTHNGITAEIRNRQDVVTYYTMCVLFNYCTIKQTRYITDNSEGVNMFMTAILSMNEETAPEITAKTSPIFKGFLTKKGYKKAMKAFKDNYEGTIW